MPILPARVGGRPAEVTVRERGLRAGKDTREAAAFAGAAERPSLAEPEGALAMGVTTRAAAAEMVMDAMVDVRVVRRCGDPRSRL